MAEIKLTNDVKIASNSTSPHGIDTSNVLASFSGDESPFEYTATQDCYVRAWGTSLDNGRWWRIDNTIVAGHYNGGIVMTFPIKKGQKVKAYTAARYSYLGAEAKVYGVK